MQYKKLYVTRAFAGQWMIFANDAAGTTHVATVYREDIADVLLRALTGNDGPFVNDVYYKAFDWPEKFRVEYLIDSDGDTPIDAALAACEAMRDPEALLPILTVYDREGRRVDVDVETALNAAGE